MPVRFSIAPSDAARIGEDALRRISDAYDSLFPDAVFLADVELATSEEIRSINKEYRSIEEPTDVLSFPTFATTAEALDAAAKTEALIGSIVICPEKVAAYDETMPQMVHHGMLHLLGYDHETDMAAWQAEERRILEGLKSNGLVIPPVPDDAV